jgi:radical SAM superfamily enzyme YgiQ (UPF0313 family)
VDVLLLMVYAGSYGAKSFYVEPLGFGYLAAALRQRGFSVRVVDANLAGLDLKSVPELVRSARPAVLGLSLWQRAYPTLRDYLGALAEARAVPGHIVLGGHFPALAAEVIMAERGTPMELVTAILRGEADDTLPEYVARAAAGRPLDDIPGIVLRDRAAPGPVPVQLDLDRLPQPHRDLLPLARAAGAPAAISSSRGCYARCAFCAIHAYHNLGGGPRWRARSPEGVADEMAQVHRDHGDTDFAFVDDNFLGGERQRSQERALRIAELAHQQIPGLTFGVQCRATEVDRDLFAGLARLGLRRVFLGVESGNQAGLNYLCKATRVEDNRRALETLESLGLGCEVGFIPFHPETTWDSLAADVKFLRDSGALLPELMLHRLRLYWGTPLRRQAELAGTRFAHPGEMDFTYADPAMEAMHRAVPALYEQYLPVLSALDGMTPPADPAAQLEYFGINARVREAYFDQFEVLLSLYRGLASSGAFADGRAPADDPERVPGVGDILGQAAGCVEQAARDLAGLRVRADACSKGTPGAAP